MWSNQGEGVREYSGWGGEGLTSPGTHQWGVLCDSTVLPLWVTNILCKLYLRDDICPPV